MGKAALLSIALHTALIAIAILIFKKDTLALKQRSKSISLSNIVLKKSETPQHIKSVVKKQENKRVKKVVKSIAKKPHVTSTPKAASSKKVVKKLHKQTKPIVKKQEKKRVKKSDKKRTKRVVAKKVEKEKSLKKASKNTTHAKRKKRRAQANKVANSSTQTKATKRETRAADPNIKAQIYQAIDQSTREPRVARKLGIVGDVYTCFSVYPGKRVSDISTSGGHPLLQKEARATIDRAKHSFPTILQTLHLCINIKFRGSR